MSRLGASHRGRTFWNVSGWEANMKVINKAWATVSFILQYA